MERFLVVVSLHLEHRVMAETAIPVATKHLIVVAGNSSTTSSQEGFLSCFDPAAVGSSFPFEVSCAETAFFGWRKFFFTGVVMKKRKKHERA